ncbi:MAG: hypothetical protein GXO89_13345 [Chlorobi bacterium]|nr:hypothetical protein [Chlorobiota bacterium]
MSDRKGYFETEVLEGDGGANSYYLDLKSDNDRWVNDGQRYRSYYYHKEEKPTIHTYFFTDRSIYRPGQTIYFKGIVLEKFKDDYSIKPNFKTKVEFYDVNYQKISEQVLTTNEYGSFQGTFTAPSGILGGQMTIKTKNGSSTISVEEYKRPKFEVVFNPIEGSYKLNEMIAITGNAKAFAGNNIDNAQVKYRVVRSTYFPYPWRYGYFGRFPSSPEIEITHGLAQTNENGKFLIQFKAIPDYSLNPEKFKPSFQYTIYADVTDINGETQSANTSVNVGSVALKINLGIAERLDKDTFKDFKIGTVNLNGQPEPAKGTIVISRLLDPQRLLRERNWSVPDKYVLGKDEFIKDFPFDEYKNEAAIENLKTNEEVANIDFDTEVDSVIQLNGTSKWKPGIYSVKVSTKDIYGQKVEMTKFFTLFSENAKTSPVNEINWFHVLKGKGEPGENASFLIGTKGKNVNVLYEVVSKDKVISSQWLKLSNEQRKIEIPIKEENRGGFSVNLTFIKHNRGFLNKFNVDVPFTNKELDFEFATFRNKLLPGQKEEWKIIIKGAKGDSVAAELLASMYDASLDALKDHNWYFRLYSNTYGNISWNMKGVFSTMSFRNIYRNRIPNAYILRGYDRLKGLGFYYYRGGYSHSDVKAVSADGERLYMRGARTDQSAMLIDGVATKGSSDLPQEGGYNNDDIIDKNINNAKVPSGPQVRRDFRETAFFFPTLQTNEKGEVLLSFTAPESLTRWKLMGLAHTKDLKYGQFEKEIVTQKDLMVIPNAPRFFREGDHISFTAKVVNLSERDLSGVVNMRFINTRTGEDITGILYPFKDIKTFAVSKGQSDMVSWDIKIPEGIDVISYRISAEAEKISDGEENAIPVLSNRMLVTESLPLPVKGNETKTFKFKKLLNSGKESNTLKNFKFTLEFSSNPVWYAVQALPYVMQPGVESADNVFNRYYANSIASHLVNSNPRIKQVFDVWKNYSPDALLSKLEKNEELKSLLLQETPWVLQASNETERKHRVALLFDMNRMSDEQATALRILKQKQSPSGGWPWFKGMRDSRNITQNIIAGLGHLRQLGVSDMLSNPITKSMTQNAVRYLDNQIREDYENLKKHNADMETDHLGSLQIQYLYARSYFLEDFKIGQQNQEAFDFYVEQAKKYVLDKSMYMQGMIALALNRVGVKSKPSEIMASIKEHALYNDEMGMYWRGNNGGYYWYQAPIETQALLIEAFDEIMNDKESVEEMKIWLLKQKQTQDWKTPKATAEAVYALMLRGSDWLANEAMPAGRQEIAEIKVGSETIDPFKRDDTKVEAGTGYFKTSWSGSDVRPEMGNITVSNTNEGIAWGAVYWQYFEDLDKITPHESPLSLGKKLFVVRNTDAGEVLEAIEGHTKLKVGDKITVRIELRSDRNLEYVHMKDMRASAFEPVNVLSGYKYGSNLGYYESTKDAATHFFFDYLRKGTYVFEYSLVVSQKGEFSNGISTIQCMYAPEFSSHSEGVRVKVD